MHYAITKKKWFRVMRCGFQSGFSKLLSITDGLSVTLGTVAGRKAKQECQESASGGLRIRLCISGSTSIQRLPLQHDGGLIRGVCRIRLAVFLSILKKEYTECADFSYTALTFLMVRRLFL